MKLPEAAHSSKSKLHLEFSHKKFIFINTIQPPTLDDDLQILCLFTLVWLRTNEPDKYNVHLGKI